ncbi:hypothetical protein [Myceligenerans crystallogenes]|uniref:DUF4190 domain-containing protein n=1 Tax=Myceligenerans crystallogenes TaxID=316335 RepID=A0ABN2N5I8_9MICO
MTYSDAGQQQQPVAGAEDPGKTMGVVGLILAFIAPLIGLIVSIIAQNKSKAAGFQNGLAKGGIIVSIIVMVLAIVATIIMVVLAAQVGTDAMQQVCDAYGPGVHEVQGQSITCE